MPLCLIQQFPQGPALCPEPDTGEQDMKLEGPIPEVFTIRLGQGGYSLHEIIRSARGLESHKL